MSEVREPFTLCKANNIVKIKTNLSERDNYKCKSAK